MKATKQDRADALERLRGWVKPGDTIYTILRHVSRSGMSRVVGVKHFECRDGQPEAGDIGFNLALAADLSYDREREGVKVGGCGMDVGFEVTYHLGRVLWPKGFTCIGEKCRSNDHSNGDRDRTPHLHQDGGYALNHRWL